MTLSETEAKQQVRDWGFTTAFTWTDVPGKHYRPHSHAGRTTHLILSGSMTVCFPEDDPSAKETYGPGERVDVPAGKVHEVWMGKDGCTYVVGE